MDLNFTKVTYDGELTDFSEDELRELVGEFESAQDSNAAEFETAAEVIDEIDSSTMEDFEDARDTLIEEITGAEAFDEVPLSEDHLSDKEVTSFSELREWRDFVAEETPKSEDETDSSDVEFDDFGTQSPTDGEEASEFVDETVDSIPGVNVQ